MSMTAGAKRGLKAEINVTPLVDVVLVLLIIFLVVTPTLQRGRAVQLPEAGGKPRQPLIPDVVSLTREGTVFLDTTEVAVADLPRLLAGRSQVMLKADTALPFSDVREVLAALRRAKVSEVALAVEVDKRK